MDHSSCMKKAIDLASHSVQKGGGPFGAVIMKDGHIVSEGHNRVTLDNDPTAHAEMQAIRIAGRLLKNFNLKGCLLYTSCEPCPMCLGAAHWARLDRIYFGAHQEDANAAGFDDVTFYHEMTKPADERSLPMENLHRDLAQAPFSLWTQKMDRTNY